MALLGRRQPFPPIFKRLIQYQAAATAPVASKPLVVSFAATESRRPVPFTRVIAKGLIQYQPIAPTASKPLVVGLGARLTSWRPDFSVITKGLIQYQPIPPTAHKPFIVSQIAFEFRRPQILHPIINRLIQYAAPAVVADPVADTPYLVTQQAVSYRRPPILRPLYGRPIQYRAAPPIAKPPIVVSFVAHNFRKPEFHGPIMKRLLGYAPAAPPPAASKPFLISQISRDEAVRRGRLLRRPITTIPFRVPGVIFPAVLRVSPGLTFVHEINDDNPRTRKALQQLSDTFNNLKRSGELSGTFANPALGYVPENTMNWGGDEPGTVREALNRIAAALTAAGFAP